MSGMNYDEFLEFLKRPDITHTELRPGCWRVSSVGEGAFGFSVCRTQRHWLLSDGKVYNYLQLTLEPPACLDDATRAELGAPPDDNNNSPASKRTEPALVEQSEPKKRKTAAPKAEESFVRVGTYQFLDLQFRKLLYAESIADQANKGLEEATSAEAASANSGSLRRLSSVLLDSAIEQALQARSALQQQLEDKPLFRGSYASELSKCARLVEKITGEKLAWQTEAKSVRLGADEDEQEE